MKKTNQNIKHVNATNHIRITSVHSKPCLAQMPCLLRAMSFSSHKLNCIHIRKNPIRSL